MENEPTPPRQSPLILLVKGWPVIVVFSMLVLVFGAWIAPGIYERGRARPELWVKNTGTVAVILRLGNQRALAQPGEDWVFKFSPGDSLEIFTRATDSGQSETVAVEAKRPDGRTASEQVSFGGKPKTVALDAKPYEKVQSEVSADNDGQIAFQATAVGRHE